MAAMADLTNPAPNSTPAATHLFTLPTELLLAITSLLPPTALLSLHLTSRTTYNLTPLPRIFSFKADATSSTHPTTPANHLPLPSQPTPKRPDLATSEVHDALSALEARDVLPTRPEYLDLLQIEQWTLFTCLWACAQCNRLRPRSKFTVAQTRGDKAKGAKMPGTPRPCSGRGRAGSFVGKLAAEERVWKGADEVALWSEQMARTGWRASGERARRGGGKSKARHAGRFCIECGVREGIYRPEGPMLTFVLDEVGGGGDALLSEGRGRVPADGDKGRGETRIGTGMVCRRCRKFAVCDVDSRAALNRRCDACLEYRPRGRR